MVASDSEDLLENVRDLREYDEKENYRLRFNYKMTDLQGALGLSQLAKLSDFISRRRKIARLYSAGLEGFPVELPQELEDRKHLFFRYIVGTGRPLAAILQAFEKKNICCRRPIYDPLHRLLGLGSGGFPSAEEVAENALSLPIYPSLKEEEIDHVIKTAQEILG